MKFDLTKWQHWGILFLFVTLSWSVAHTIKLIPTEQLPIQSIFLEIPGFFAVFSILLTIFDKWCWKWSIWKYLGVIDFPNLSGKYKGEFSSSFQDPKTGKNFTGEMTLEIVQTASKIKIKGKFNKSKSISTQATWGFNENELKTCLYYFFKNTPGQHATETMHLHEGSCILTYDDTLNSLHGEYYSGRDRNNYGYINVSRIKRK